MVVLLDSKLRTLLTLIVSCLLSINNDSKSISIGSSKNTYFAVMAKQITPMKRVFVSGAGGQTGKLLFEKLIKHPDKFEVIGGVRTEESKKSLLEFIESRNSESSRNGQYKVEIIDITKEEQVRGIIKGCNAVMICSSATPVPTNDIDPKTGRKIMGFSEGGHPKQVDWIGQVNQIDAAKSESKNIRIILCSSMGGTNPEHFLNTIGRSENDYDTGNILLWKRKAERYLIQSALPYTIIHPGGLTNEQGAQRELVLGVDDLMDGTESRTVPRSDVAELMLQSLIHPDTFSNRSFDVRAKPLSSSDITTPTDFIHLEKKWLHGTKNCNYDLGKKPGFE